MTQNKKFGLIFILLVVLPVVSVCFINYSDDTGAINIETSTRNLLNVITLIISIIGNVVVIILNYKSNGSKIFWYIIPIILLILLSFFLLIGYAVINFGF